MLAGNSTVAKRNKCIHKTMSTFRGKIETGRRLFFYNKTSIFAIFSKTNTRWYYFENTIIFSFPNGASWQNIEQLTWILLFSADVWFKKLERFFFHISTPRSVIFRIFIYVFDDHVAFTLLFQNSCNLKTNTTKILVLVLQKTVTVGSFLSWPFYTKKKLYNSMIFNVLYREI